MIAASESINPYAYANDALRRDMEEKLKAKQAKNLKSGDSELHFKNQVYQLELVQDDALRELQEEQENAALNQVLELYNCADFIPFVNRIFWLDSIREALGFIPAWVNLSYMEIRGLVILKDELGKRTAFNSWKMQKESERANANISGKAGTLIPTK